MRAPLCVAAPAFGTPGVVTANVPASSSARLPPKVGVARRCFPRRVPLWGGRRLIYHLICPFCQRQANFCAYALWRPNIRFWHCDVPSRTSFGGIPFPPRDAAFLSMRLERRVRAPSARHGLNTPRVGSLQRHGGMCSCGRRGLIAAAFVLPNEVVAVRVPGSTSQRLVDGPRVSNLAACRLRLSPRHRPPLFVHP